MRIKQAVIDFLGELIAKPNAEAIQMLESYSMTLYQLGIDKGIQQGKEQALEEWVKAQESQYGPN